MTTLMIVDDSNIIRNQITRIGAQNFQVVATAANGEEAIAHYRKYRPDIVTMDLTMPKVDGLACIQAIMDIDPEAKILVVSALSDQETGLEALELGACGFLMKPVNESDLSQMLMQLASM